MKTTKRIATLFMFIMVLFTTFSIPFTNVNAEEKTYTIGTDITFAPFEFQDVNGDFVGIDMDLLEAIAKDQGFNYEVKPLGFNAAVQALESKQVDAVIAGMSITEERAKKFDFSDPYFDSGVIMAVDEDNESVSSYEDLKGERVAVKTGQKEPVLLLASKMNMALKLLPMMNLPICMKMLKQATRLPHLMITLCWPME